ncbi:MAG: hypothetical protein GY898_10950 [Proteobacteria bacterium]|nr:hypothetical protein [Pseudomonadota bacterium]
MRSFAPLALALLFVVPTAVSADDDPVFAEIGRQHGEIEQAVRDVEALSRDANQKQEMERLSCLSDRLMYLKGLSLAGSTAVDEYAVAQHQADDQGRTDAVQKVGRAWAAMPPYLEEAKACGTETEWVSDERCVADEVRVGVPCTKWRITFPERRGFAFGNVDGGHTVAGRARPTD